MIPLFQFFSDYQVPYIEYGKNVAKGNINIKCPLCNDDPSEHLGINPEELIWSCWRDSRHRGYGLASIVKIVVRCTKVRAVKIALQYDGKSFLEDNEFWDEMEFLLNETKTIDKLKKVEHLSFPKEFRSISRKGVGRKFLNYLENRGILNIGKTVDKYNIKCCLSGYWRNRLIFPIFDAGKLITWTSRSIYNLKELTYNDLSIEQSVTPIKSCLFGQDYLTSGTLKNILWVVEGPFDALILDQFLPEDQEVTCLFTKTIRKEQLQLFYKLQHIYKEIHILLDRDALAQSHTIASELGFFKKIYIRELPKGIDDPGNLGKQAAYFLLNS